MRRATLIAAAIAVCGLATAAQARPAIVISQAVARASIGHSPNTAAYMTITNRGDAPDRLMGAACDCAAQVELHDTKTVNGVASMSSEASVTIPAHGSVAFQPDGRHLMVMGLTHPLADGQVQAFTLTFEHAGALKADFQVRERISSGGMSGMGGMGSMPGMDMGR